MVQSEPSEALRSRSPFYLFFVYEQVWQTNFLFPLTFSLGYEFEKTSS